MVEQVHNIIPATCFEKENYKRVLREKAIIYIRNTGLQTYEQPSAYCSGTRVSSNVCGSFIICDK